MNNFSLIGVQHYKSHWNLLLGSWTDTLTALGLDLSLKWSSLGVGLVSKTKTMTRLLQTMQFYNLLFKDLNLSKVKTQMCYYGLKEKINFKWAEKSCCMQTVCVDFIGLLMRINTSCSMSELKDRTRINKVNFELMPKEFIYRGNGALYMIIQTEDIPTSVPRRNLDNRSTLSDAQ